MRNRARKLAQGAVLAALYAVLTYLQNGILPGSATWAVQLRLSEMLCVLAFFTPAAPMGLAVGCLVFNLGFGGALPLDFALGSLATYLAGKGMWRLRKWPWLGACMPAVTNGILIGGELALYMGGGFGMNAGYVALGELIVLLGPGMLLYRTLKNRRLPGKLFQM